MSCFSVEVSGPGRGEAKPARPKATRVRRVPDDVTGSRGHPGSLGAMVGARQGVAGRAESSILRDRGGPAGLPAVPGHQSPPLLMNQACQVVHRLLRHGVPGVDAKCLAELAERLVEPARPGKRRTRLTRATSRSGRNRTVSARCGSASPIFPWLSSNSPRFIRATARSGFRRTALARLDAASSFLPARASAIPRSLCASARPGCSRTASPRDATASSIRPWAISASPSPW